MKNLKKLDDKDVVFLDQPWTKEEREKFSAFLKTRKTNAALKKTRRAVRQRKKKTT